MGESNVKKIYYATCAFFLSMQNCTPNPQIFSHVSFLLFVPPQFFAFSELWSLWSMVPACLCFKLGVVAVSNSSSQQLSLFFYFFFIFFETDVEICFRNLWNECRHPFRYFFGFFVKRISKSVSGICETDVNIRFVIFFGFSMKRMSKSASGICETDFDIRFDIFFFCFFWNGYQNPFQEFCETDFEAYLMKVYIIVMEVAISLFAYNFFFSTCTFQKICGKKMGFVQSMSIKIAMFLS